MTLAITQGHQAARNAASMAYADSGPGNSRLRLYDGSDVFLGACLLAKPCAELQADGTLLLLPAQHQHQELLPSPHHESGWQLGVCL